MDNVLYKIYKQFENFGNILEIDLGHLQPVVDCKCFKFVHSGWESIKKYNNRENVQRNHSDTLKNMEKLRIHGTHVASVGDADLKSWEMVENLLISEVWEP